VASVTIMRENQAVIIQIKHGNRMIVLGGIVFSRLAHLMYKGVTAGGYAQGDISHDSIAHFFYWRVSGDCGAPSTGESFKLIERFLRVRLWCIRLGSMLVRVSLGKGHGGKR